MRKMKLAAAVTLAAMTVAGPALAATATANLGVSINLTNQCKVTGDSINFGTGVGLLDTAINVSGTIAVRCTKGTTYTIGLNQGTGDAATVTDRKMSKDSTPGPTAEVVSYSLAMDSFGGTNWGNAIGSWVSGPPLGAASSAAVNYTVYGTVPVQSTPSQGSYGDTVTITVTY